MSRVHLRSALAVLTTAGLAVTAAGCAGWGGGPGGGGPDTINVLMVNNPQMIDLQRLTEANFTKATGIHVNYTVLPENDVRDKISQEFSSQAGQYDVASLSNFEIPIYAKSKWIAPLGDYAKADTTFDQPDILPSMTQSLTAATVMSCSTTTTVLPLSTRRSSCFISFATSDGCSPVVGSSST